MDFFTRQAKAIRQTKILVGYFLLAVIVITFAVNLVFYLALASQESFINGIKQWFSDGLWIYISASTLAIIILTSIYRSWQINSNPEAIIKMANATRVPLETSAQKQKQLINIVEEMSIASGMPIPKIYIMQNEQGLNAFVSGLKPSTAILVVTQGLLNTLNRQQLQGVIGHEFSHILNGDMRLNLRLMGIVAGILVLGQVGQFILRGGSHSHHSYSSSGFGSSSKGKRSGGSAILIIGLGLFVIGYIGLFFGRVIKAAISRQREFLADASAVQFTRDRSGIAGALLSIKNATEGSQLNIASAEEMSHMCFSRSSNTFFNIGGWLASHPPLEDRIQAIYPGYLRLHGDKNQSTKRNNSTTASEALAQFVGQLFNGERFTSRHSNQENISSQTRYFQADETHIVKVQAEHSDIAFSVSNEIGNTTPEHLEKSQRLFRQLPKNLLEIARGEKISNEIAEGPLHLILILFTIANNSELETRKKRIEQYLSVEKIDNIELIKNQLEKLNFKSRHALFDIALARIADFELAQKQELFRQLKNLITDSKNLSPSGLMIYASIANQVTSTKSKKPFENQINRYKKVSSALDIFLHQLLKENNYKNTQWKNAEHHQQQILKSFGINTIPKQITFNAKVFHQALNQLARLKPLLKKELILSVTDAIQVDNKIAENEFDFLRLLCEYLDCPIPLD